MDREIEAMDRLVIAVAQGTGIAWGGQEAYDAWRRGRQEEEQKDDRRRSQAATIARIAAMFPGSVKVRN